MNDREKDRELTLIADLLRLHMNHSDGTPIGSQEVFGLIKKSGITDAERVEQVLQMFGLAEPGELVALVARPHRSLRGHLPPRKRLSGRPQSPVEPPTRRRSQSATPAASPGTTTPKVKPAPYVPPPAKPFSMGDNPLLSLNLAVNCLRQLGVHCGSWVCLPPGTDELEAMLRQGMGASRGQAERLLRQVRKIKGLWRTSCAPVCGSIHLSMDPILITELP